MLAIRLAWLLNRLPMRRLALSLPPSRSPAALDAPPLSFCDLVMTRDGQPLRFIQVCGLRNRLRCAAIIVTQGDYAHSLLGQSFAAQRGHSDARIAGTRQMDRDWRDRPCTSCPFCNGGHSGNPPSYPRIESGPVPFHGHGRKPLRAVSGGAFYGAGRRLSAQALYGENPQSPSAALRAAFD